MVEQLFKWFRDVMFIIIPGLIYFADIILVLQTSINMNFLDIIEQYRSYILFIAIIIVLISYVFGYLSDLAMRGSYYWIWHLKKNREKFRKGILSQVTAISDAEKKYQEISSTYFSRLIMVRNLIVSIIILFIILRVRQIGGNIIVPVFIVSLIALISAYFLLRDRVKQIEKIKPNQ